MATDQARACAAITRAAAQKTAQATQARIRRREPVAAPRLARQERQWFTPSQVVAHSWHTTLPHDMQTAYPRRSGWWAQLCARGNAMIARSVAQRGAGTARKMQLRIALPGC